MFLWPVLAGVIRLIRMAGLVGCNFYREVKNEHPVPPDLWQGTMDWKILSHTEVTEAAWSSKYRESIIAPPCVQNTFMLLILIHFTGQFGTGLQGITHFMFVLYTVEIQRLIYVES